MRWKVTAVAVTIALGSSLAGTAAHAVSSSKYIGETLAVEVTPHDGRSTIGDNFSLYSLTDAQNDRTAAQQAVKAAKAKASKRAVARAEAKARVARKCYRYIANAWKDVSFANAGVDTSNCPWTGKYLVPFWAGTNDAVPGYVENVPERYRLTEADRLRWGQHQNLVIPANLPNSAEDVSDNPADAQVLLDRFYPQLEQKYRDGIAKRVGTEFIQVRRSTHPDIIILLGLGGYERNITDDLRITYVNAKTGTYSWTAEEHGSPTAVTLMGLTWSTIPPAADPNSTGVCLTPPCQPKPAPVADPNVFYGYIPGVEPGSMGAWTMDLDNTDPKLGLNYFYIAS